MLYLLSMSLNLLLLNSTPLSVKTLYGGFKNVGNILSSNAPVTLLADLSFSGLTETHLLQWSTATRQATFPLLVFGIAITSIATNSKGLATVIFQTGGNITL